MNIPPRENVKLSPEDEAMAAALALDDRVVMALVDIIFAQQDGHSVPS